MDTPTATAVIPTRTTPLKTKGLALANTPRKHAHKRTPHPSAGRTERSRSIPNNLAAISQEAFDDGFLLPAASGTSDGPMSLSQSLVSTTTGFVFSASSSPILGPSHGIFKPKAVYPPKIQPSVSAGSNRTMGTPPLPHAHTDPLPLPMRRRHKHERDRSLKRPSSARPEAIEQSFSQHDLPRVLVVSGLEHAPEATHQALARALVDRKFSLPPTAHHPETPFNLPDGFFVVYVCPWDPADRPAVHKPLLDKFAMSNNVALTQTTQLKCEHTVVPLLPGRPHPEPIIATVTTLYATRRVSIVAMKIVDILSAPPSCRLLRAHIAYVIHSASGRQSPTRLLNDNASHMPIAQLCPRSL